MTEVFAKPAVGAIIEKTENGKKYILLQTRRKAGGGEDNGLTEIPAGKLREYENVFSALRREVREETGLTLTHIEGEERTVSSASRDYATLSFEPFCVTQNLSGGYAIVLNTFLCRAEGEPFAGSDETENIRWEPAAEAERQLRESPASFYPMHLNALRKYFAEFPAK